MIKIFFILCQNAFYNLVEYVRFNEEIAKMHQIQRRKIWTSIKLNTLQKKQIDTLFVKNYGKKVPHTWHRHYMAFTGNFDANYFPDLLYFPQFETYENYKQNYIKSISDKNLLPCFASAVHIKMPQTLLSCAEGFFRDGGYRPLSAQEFVARFDTLGEAFVKPSVDSNSGQGCAVIHMEKGKDILSGKTSKEIIRDLGDNFVVQARLKCHKSIAKIYPHSVNTFRIITYRWKEEICHMPIIMRIGRGGKNLDNAHAGGIFIAVDDNGILHSTAFSEFNEQYAQHPDTHVVFDSYVIPNLDKLLSAAKRMHALLPQLGCYHWDFTLDEAGYPILLEANSFNGSIWLAQMAHGKGVFGNKTPEILRWLGKMRKLPYSKRKFYKYGYQEKHF